MMNGLNIEILKCKAFNGDQQKQQKLEEGERWSKRTTSNKNSAETREENERKSMRRECEMGSKREKRIKHKKEGL